MFDADITQFKLIGNLLEMLEKIRYFNVLFLLDNTNKIPLAVIFPNDIKKVVRNFIK